MTILYANDLNNPGRCTFSLDIGIVCKWLGFIWQSYFRRSPRTSHIWSLYRRPRRFKWLASTTQQLPPFAIVAYTQAGKGTTDVGFDREWLWVIPACVYIHSIHCSCASWVSLDLSFNVVQVIRWNFVCQLCDQPLLAIIAGSVVHFPHENSIFESISVLVLIPLDAVEKGFPKISSAWTLF